MSNPNGILSCSKRDGGLGIPKLEALVTSTMLKQGIILLNSLQHARSNHSGVGILYSCNTCGKTYKGKHAAQCHVPKCKGPSTVEGKNEFCGICKKDFGSQRGTSTHEPLMYPAERNKKREKPATNRQTRGPNKGNGKVWLKEEVDIMIRLEKSLQGDLRLAKQKMEHLPGKTAKQIRDKRKEPSYKVVVEQQDSTNERTATPGTLERMCSISVARLRHAQYTLGVTYLKPRTNFCRTEARFHGNRAARPGKRRGHSRKGVRSQQ